MLAVRDPHSVDDLLASIASFLRENQLRRRTPQPDRPRQWRAALASSDLPPAYQTIVDDALQLVYSQHHRIISRLYPAALPNLSLDQLRQGPLGEDLSRLAQIAAGTHRAGQEAVLGAIDSVLQLLFWPVGAEFYTVPRSFWEQPLGKMLSLAKLRTFRPEDLISIGNAASMLNVTRATIYRWMDDKVLDFARDDLSGRTFVVRQDVEAMKADLDAELRARESGEDSEEEATPVAPDAAQLPLWSLGEEELGPQRVVPSPQVASPPSWEQQTLEKLAEIAHELQGILGEQEESDDSPTSVGVRIVEEPLAAQSVALALSALTVLHTKLWLIARDRLTDVVRYAQTRNPAFEREANLVITRLSYNSPADIRLDVGAAEVQGALSALTADASEGRGKLARLWDDFAQAKLRWQEKEQALRAREDALRREREWFEQQLAERRQEAGHDARVQALHEREVQLSLREKELDIEARQVALDREKTALQAQRYESELNRLKIATDTAMLMIERLRPDITDPAARALLAHELVPQLLQLESGGHVQLLLPTPDKPGGL